MKTMKRFLLLLSCSCAGLWGADLAGIRSVYVLPMARGLDQHLANRLTNDHLFQVVTDSKMADAVFTDHIGEGFQTQMETLFPPPPCEQPAKKEKDKKHAKEEKHEEPNSVTLATETLNKRPSPS